MNRRDFIFNSSASMVMLAVPYKAVDSVSIGINNHNAIRINGFNMLDYFLNHKMKYIYEFKECTRIELLKQGYFGQYFDTAVFMGQGKIPENKIQYGMVQSPLPDSDHVSRKIDILWSDKMNDFFEYVKMDWSSEER